MKRVGGSFEELNARIARLAIALGVSLETDDAVQRVLGMAGVRAKAAPPEGLGERRRQRVAFSGQDRRQTHKWVELRGLLILRYGVEKQYVEAYGLEATRQLRQWEREHGLEPLPVVALTANAQPSDRDRCLAAGMNGHLPKPFKQEDLADVMQRFLLNAG